MLRSIQLSRRGSTALPVDQQSLSKRWTPPVHPYHSSRQEWSLAKSSRREVLVMFVSLDTLLGKREDAVEVDDAESDGGSEQQDAHDENGDSPDTPRRTIELENVIRTRSLVDSMWQSLE